MGRYVLVSLLFFSVNVTIHVIAAAWAVQSFPALARRRRLVIGLAAIGIVVPPLARWSSLGAASPVFAWIHAAGASSFALFLFSAVPLAILVGARWLFDRRVPPPAPPAPPATITSRRQILEATAGLGVLGATGAALGWGMVRGRHAFVVEEVPVKIPGLPRALDGYVIVQISDLHGGILVGEREIAEGLDRVRELRPDLLVATGDLVDCDPRFVELVARAIARVPARDGAFAVLGNHDYYAGAPAVRAGLEAAGIRTLMNSAVTIREGDGGGFALLGVTDLMTRALASAASERTSLPRAIAAAAPERPRILLAHQPVFFDESRGQVALQLSGHTHGGQINPGGVRPVGLLLEYVAGRYERGGSTLWVNRGFGVAGPPSRVAAPPEVTKIVLVAG